MAAWESLAATPNRSSLSWVAQYEFRFAEGLLELSDTPPEPPRSPRSLLWLRDAVARPLDFLSLTAMSDAFFGRIFQVIGRHAAVRHGLDDHLLPRQRRRARAPTAPRRSPRVADARVFHRSFGDQTAELYGRGGQLLATAVQVAYFRA